MSADKEETVLEVIEEKDGSAVVELPEELAPEEEQKAEGGEVVEDGDEDHPDDTDAIRSARRARRKAKKEYIKRTNEEKDQRLQMLARQNELMAQRLAELERKSHGADLARLDAAIADEKSKCEYYLGKMREATDNSDGTAHTRAQEAWYESRRKIEALQGIKNSATQNASQDSGPANPQMIRLANEWMDKNSWYDPSGGDEDSQIAKVIDNRLASEGWDPSTRDYWEEFNRRLRNRLPHRYTADQDDNPRRKPRSFVTGSSRESSASREGNTFVLTPEQVRAMKDAGFWDDPATRAKMIRRYAEQARNNRG